MGNLPLAWGYAQSPQDHHRFRNMLWIPLLSFHVLLGLIEPHPIFQSGSQNAQVEVEIQLAVTLYRMGRYGNGASVQEVAHVAGISEGSVEIYTERCLTAIESLHDMFVHQLTPEEKEQEKKWVDEHLGFMLMRCTYAESECTEDRRDGRIGATEYAEGNRTRKRGGDAEHIT